MYFEEKSYYIFNPLCANVEHTRHDADVTCSGCSAPYRQNHKKMV